MRHLGNLSLAVGIDVLRGQLGDREARAVLCSIRETRRTVEVGQRIGPNREVLDAVGGDGAEAGPAG